MRGFSKAIIAGNLTRDPELRATSTGNNVCSFGVAVNRSYRSSTGEQREEVMFIDCSAWGRTGETIAQYARRGSAIIVSGRLGQREWEGRDGVKHTSIDITVDDFVFAGGGGSSQRDNAPYGSGYNNNGYNNGYGNNFGGAGSFGNTPAAFGVAPAPSTSADFASVAPAAPVAPTAPVASAPVSAPANFGGGANVPDEAIPSDIPEGEIDLNDIPF